MSLIPEVAAPASPRARICVGISGHREDNAAFMVNRQQVERVLRNILDLIDQAAEREGASGGASAPRMHSLLAEGADQMAADAALERGWKLVAPLPFGLALNVAINAHPESAMQARALLAGTEAEGVGNPAVSERASRIRALAARASLFELADRDAVITELYIAKFESPHDPRVASVFAAESSLRAALAGRVMVEQSDFLIAVWDGATRALVGGTGHTIQAALEAGAPVVWIDPASPDRWRILHGPEALAQIHASSTTAAEDGRHAELAALVRTAVRPAVVHAQSSHRRFRPQPGPETLAQERWPVQSWRMFHLYRRVEAVFGATGWRARFRNLRQTYESPDRIETGSAAGLCAHARALPGLMQGFLTSVETAILRRFAWADGVSAHLSDIYRGGMTANFLLAPLAIVGGIAYLPFATSHEKWLFAVFELLLLAAILWITFTGRKRRWHGRWFETRRVAEYLRHAPILLFLGVARPPGRWPVGTQTSWPEWYARHALREAGLPQVAITPAYLRAATKDLLQEHVTRQRDYHIDKARRLAAVHHNLDRISEILFALAVVSVTGYLVLKGGGVLHLWPLSWSETTSYLFTFFGVLLPTFGGALAGIRYFGDFERFAAISTVTAEKLQAIQLRIAQLLAAPDTELDYGRVAELAHAMDDVVVSEIGSWQAVFGGKQVTVPV